MENNKEKPLKAVRREKKKKPKMAVHGRSFKRMITKLEK
jgi:hypothetical protein